ncbi:MAG TPA: biotin/lipoyl-containing protein, partial [Acidimicrobiales bacterium]|nr:biotin/lipoyl-containing protein [Acidimicrobiales bacterium]
ALRWESGVDEGSVVTVNFDPLLAKVISYAPTRELAAATLALGLERVHLGGVTTNRDFLVNALRSDVFLRGEATTDFVENPSIPRSLEASEDDLVMAACAGALWLQGLHRREARVLGDAPSGWRNARLPRQHVELAHDERSFDVAYVRRRDGSFDLGQFGVAKIHGWGPRHLDVEINARRRWVSVTLAAGHLFVQTLRGTIDFSVIERFPVRQRDAELGGLSAPMPGRILDVRVSSGQIVRAGDSLVVMEAMKMEHVIAASRDGVVGDVLVHADQQVERGTTLLTMRDDS